VEPDETTTRSEEYYGNYEYTLPEIKTIEATTNYNNFPGGVENQLNNLNENSRRKGIYKSQTKDNNYESKRSKTASSNQYYFNQSNTLKISSTKTQLSLFLVSYKLLMSVLLFKF
jgi:hypothetical protein